MKMYSNYTLLIACACFQGYEEAKFLLQEMKVDINEQAKNGETALIRAVHFNDYEMVELLLKAGANTELRTKQSISALITAITREKPLLVDLLLKYGTEIDMKIQKSTIQTLILKSWNGGIHGDTLVLEKSGLIRRTKLEPINGFRGVQSVFRPNFRLLRLQKATISDVEK